MEDHLFKIDEEFTEIYQRNVSRVYKLSLIYLKNNADAEDAVQAVFLKFLQSPPAFHSLEHEKAWFITTTKNCCKDQLKCWWKRQRVYLDKLPEIASCEEHTQEQLLMEKLFALPEKYRLVLHLYYLEDYSIKEIAALLKRNESTVRSQLHRGREKLKTELGGNYYGQANCEQNI